MSNKRMLINGFAQVCAASQTYGQWKDPADRTAREYKDVQYWIDLAKLCERGFFDSMFFADVHGTYDVYNGSAEACLRHGVQVPGTDPTTLPVLLAHETEHIGFIATYSTSYFSPFHTAKLFSTLDHYTKGRIGWNIVTSYLDSAYRNGMGELLSHDERYDRADEYMDVAYQLWERSWDDDAVVFDEATSSFADPSKVYKINHKGKYFEVEGPHQCEPSPQRTPFLVQAGGSGRGTAFAGRHGEAVFATATSLNIAKESTRKLREAAAKEGRDPNSLKVLLGVTCVVAETSEEARRKYDRFASMGVVEGALSLFGGWTGVDLSSFKPEDTMSAFESDGMQHIATLFGSIDGEKDWTFADMCDYMKVSSIIPVFVGTPDEVADELESWMDEADLDGFNLLPIVNPGDFEDFVEFVVPVLQRRGRMRTAYEGSTLRELVFGEGQTGLLDDHPAHRILDGLERTPIA